VGLITGLVLAPVAPVRGVLWVAGKITDEVNRQYSGEGAIVKQLREVDEARRSGRLSEEEAAAREEELLRRRIAATRGPRPVGAGHG
jgi:Gas vesicle protein G